MVHRDSYETFTGLLADGDMASARAMVQFLYDRTQQPDGSFPRDSLLDGAVAPDTFGLVEIDEDAYPLLMAWEAGFAGNVSFYRDHIRPDAGSVRLAGMTGSDPKADLHRYLQQARDALPAHQPAVVRQPRDGTPQTRSSRGRARCSPRSCSAG